MRSFPMVMFSISLVAACGSGGGSSDDDDDPVDAPNIDTASIDAPIPIDAPQIAIDAGIDAPPGVAFTRHVIDPAAIGPAYVAVGDVDGNGSVDVVASHFGVMAGLMIPNGQVTLYRRGANLGSWTRSDIVPASAQVKFPGQPTLVDIDGDQDLDMILPSGFLVCAAIPGGTPCGGLAWYEQNAGAWTRHDIVPLGADLFYHHAQLVDMDGDGIKDLVTAGEMAGGLGGGGMAQTRWFKGNASANRFETTAREIGSGGGSFPRVLDVDGDGDLDVASAQFFVTPSFVWFERTGATAWTRHTVNTDMGASIMMTAVDNLYGDGVRRYVGANHTNTASTPTEAESAVSVFTPAASPQQPWTKAKISQGIVSRANMGFARLGAPGIFGTGDMDDDGDIDIVVSGDGDERVFFLDQIAPGQFVTRVLETGLGQAGGVTVADLDSDNDRETIITGYEDNVIYAYSH